MKGLACVILAAGQSTRMKSAKSKVMHDLAGAPVVSYSLGAARKLGARPVVVVTGPNDGELRSYVKGEGLESVIQRNARGTADAVASARGRLAKFKGDVLILCGDVPLIRPENLEAFVKAMRAKKAKLGVLTMTPDKAAAYGRIVRDLDGRITRIVEAKDASSDELEIREVNSGIICADREWLFRSLGKIGNDNAKGEYYLTDLVGIALKEGVPVIAHHGGDAEDFLGINTRVDLAEVAELMRYRINQRHMMGGVGILDYRHTYIDDGVKLGRDTTVMPHAFLRGKTRVGENCVIENGVVMTDAVVGDSVHIKAYSVLDGCAVSDGAILGPFARVRPDSKVGKDVHIGNFVELKKATVRRGAKANHLSYIGDSVVGEGTNIGAGTITCNYDGVSKYQTVIGKDVFVGSDTQFIAPVKIGAGSVIGAGSTITRDVPADSLALSRVDQIVVRGWAAKRRKKKRKKK